MSNSTNRETNSSGGQHAFRVHSANPTSPYERTGGLTRSDQSLPAELPRRVTEPLPATLLRAPRPEASQSRPRNRSPYSRSHLRSYSAAGALTAPPMARTRSLPNAAARPLTHSPSHSPVRPSSPLRSPVAVRPSPRRSFEDFRHQTSTPSFMDIESIAEDSELDIAPRAPPADSGSPSIPSIPLHHAHTIPRSAPSSRRSSGSLHSHQVSMSSPPSSHHSPSPPPSRYNEAYPSALPGLPTNYSTSSMPSTPTSHRSRSPSISSLETIPDSPDAEQAAMEAFNIAKLKAAVEAAESGSDSDGERRSRSSSNLRASTEKSQKRWSVCGAERRGDFEMETIWED